MSNIPLLHLHVDILINIFKRLKLKDLRALMLTCKYLRGVILNSNPIWKYVARGRLILCNHAENRKPYPLNWYNRVRVSNNWCNGFYKSKAFINHNKNYMPWLICPDSKVVLLSVGSDLCCYNMDKKGLPCNSLLWKIEGPIIKRNDIRTQDVSRYVVKSNYIICGSRNGCTSVYKYENIKEKPTPYQFIKHSHQNGLVEVSAVEFIEDTSPCCIITGSIYSTTVKYWSLNTEANSEIEDHPIKPKQQILLNNCMGVKSFAVNQKQQKLAIGPNGNRRPHVLDLGTNKLLVSQVQESMNLRHAIRDIQWHSEHVMSFVTQSGLLQLIDIRNDETVFDVTDPFQSTLYCLKSDGDHAIVVGSSEYSRCVLFDTRKLQKHVQMYFTQGKNSSPVYSLDFDSSKLIAAADRTVSLLNYNVNSTTTRQRNYSYAFELVVR